MVIVDLIDRWFVVRAQAGVGTFSETAGGLKGGIAAVIPVAGRPELLQEALHSIYSGEVKPERVIVAVDSVGADRARDAAAAAAVLSAVPLEIVYSDEGGPGRARNLAALQAREEWLAFLDSDDLWEPGKLKAQCEAVKKRPHFAAVTTGERWMKGGKEIRQPIFLRPFPGRRLADALAACRFSMSSLMIRRDIFFEIGGFDPDFFVCEDFDFFLRYLSRHPMGLVDAPHVIKRSGGWPQLSAQPGLDRERVLALLKLAHSPGLHAGEQVRLWESIEAKANVFCAGARRRGRDEEALALESQIAAARARKPDGVGPVVGGISLAV